MGFVGYFLVVSDFIQWARAHNIPVGPGRGSAAGSLVAWALQITDIDPIKYNLLFERFLNPERVSMPDIDIDFCIEGRDKVINYVRDKYGHDQCVPDYHLWYYDGKGRYQRCCACTWVSLLKIQMRLPTLFLINLKLPSMKHLSKNQS